MAVIDKDRSSLHLPVPGMRDAADIVTVAEHQQGKNPYHGMFYSMDTTHEMFQVLFALLPDPFRDFKP